MKLLSLRDVFLWTAKTIARFPLTIFSAYSVTILAIIANHRADSQEVLVPYILALLLAFPLSLAFDLFMESRKAKASAKFFARIIVIALSAGAYFYLFKDWGIWRSGGSEILQVVLLDKAVWTLVLFAPFLLPNRTNAFWQFAIALLVRMVQALFYFGILFLGALALMASIDYLFELSILDDYVFDVWMVITGVFASLFFLSGVPGNFQVLDKTTAYPKLLRVLLEYFLVPLVYLYMAVLYVYSLKSLITWEWPLGDFSNWIVGFSGVGVLTYFFIHSTKERFFHYVEFFKKWFFVFLLPLIVVLFLVVGMKIKEASVTESRYLIVAFGVWLLVLSVYFILSKAKNLKFIPITMFVVLLVSSYGPQSASAVAKKYQLASLEKVLIENQILVNGKVVQSDFSKVSEEDKTAISSVVRYVVERYGVETLQSWFEEDLTKAAKVPVDPWNDHYWTDDADNVLRLMGFADYYQYGYLPFIEEDPNYVNFLRKEDCKYDLSSAGCAVKIDAYNYYYNFGFGSDSPENEIGFSVGDKRYSFEANNIDFLSVKDANGNKLVTLDVRALANTLLAEFPDAKGMKELPAERLTFKFSALEIRIQNINLKLEDGKYDGWDWMSGELLLR